MIHIDVTIPYKLFDGSWIVDPHCPDSLRHGGTSCRSSCVTGERAAICVQDGFVKMWLLGDLFKSVSLSFIFIWKLEQAYF